MSNWGDFKFSYLVLNIPGETDLFSELVGTKTKGYCCSIFIVFGYRDFFDFTSKFWNVLSSKIGFAS